MTVSDRSDTVRGHALPMRLEPYIKISRKGHESEVWFVENIDPVSDVTLVVKNPPTQYQGVFIDLNGRLTANDRDRFTRSVEYVLRHFRSPGGTRLDPPGER